MDSESVMGWIDQLSDGNQQAAGRCDSHYAGSGLARASHHRPTRSGLTRRSVDIRMIQPGRPLIHSSATDFRRDAWGRYHADFHHQLRIFREAVQHLASVAELRHDKLRAAARIYISKENPFEGTIEIYCARQLLV